MKRHTIYLKETALNSLSITVTGED
jgi:hypothetical protein